MTAKTGSLTPVVGGFKLPRGNSYHYDGSVRKREWPSHPLLHPVVTSNYRLERRVRRGATTMKARPQQTRDREEQEQQIYVIAHRPVSGKQYRNCSTPGLRPFVMRPDAYKIGVSNDVDHRLDRLQTGTPNKLELITTLSSAEPKQVEQALHSGLHRCWLGGEWFYLDEVRRRELKQRDSLELADIEAITQPDYSEVLEE